MSPIASNSMERHKSTSRRLTKIHFLTNSIWFVTLAPKTHILMGGGVSLLINKQTYLFAQSQVS